MPDWFDRGLLEVARIKERAKNPPPPQAWAFSTPPLDPDPVPRYVPPRPVYKTPEAAVPAVTAEQVTELLRLITPLKFQAPDTGKWYEVLPAAAQVDVDRVLSRLRDARVLYEDEQTDKMVADWQHHPAVLATAEYERSAAEEKIAEARQARERETRRQAHADQLFANMIEAGATFAEAQQAVARQFPERET
jgi:hypothetical protein